MKTLLVFAKQPLPGRVKTRLARTLGDAGACALYRAFLADLAGHLGELEGLAVTWWIDGDPAPVRAACGAHWQRGWQTRLQPPGDLGARLEAGFAAAFGAGAAAAAAVGSDCPHCPPARYRELLAAVAGGADAALLPAEDGGYAGLALAAPAPELFREMPWSTPEVTALTLARLRRARRRVVVLSPEFDVDSAAELTRLRELLDRDPGRAPHTAAALGAGSRAPAPATPGDRTATRRNRCPARARS